MKIALIGKICITIDSVAIKSGDSGDDRFGVNEGGKFVEKEEGKVEGAIRFDDFSGI